MQQAIDILDEMIKETQKNINDRHHTDTTWMNFDTCESNILSLAKLKIQALWDWWIPVEERLPEWELTEYLVFTNYWTIEVSTFYDLKFIQPFSEVTHWMELPLQPNNN